MLATLATILGAIAPIVTIATAFGLFKLLAVKLDEVGDKAVADAAKTPDPNDDRIAHIEKDALHTIAGLLESGAVSEGLAKLRSLPALQKKP